MRTIKVEIRADNVRIEGYVNTTLRDSLPLSSPQGKFVEQVEQHVFERALHNNPDVELRFNHRSDMILGSTKDGSLSLYEDNIGLKAEATVTDPVVIDKAKKGELRGWSFGFIPNKQNWKTDSDKGIQRRFLQDIDLKEVSILDRQPAYTACSIEMRGDEEVVSEQRDFIDENVETIDNSPKEEQPKDEDKPEVRDYSLYERTVEVLKLKKY